MLAEDADSDFDLDPHLDVDLVLNLSLDLDLTQESAAGSGPGLRSGLGSVSRLVDCYLGFVDDFLLSGTENRLCVRW